MANHRHALGNVLPVPATRAVAIFASLFVLQSSAVFAGEKGRDSFTNYAFTLRQKNSPRRFVSKVLDRALTTPARKAIAAVFEGRELTKLQKRILGAVSPLRRAVLLTEVAKDLGKNDLLSEQARFAIAPDRRPDLSIVFSHEYPKPGKALEFKGTADQVRVFEQIMAFNTEVVPKTLEVIGIGASGSKSPALPWITKNTAERAQEWRADLSLGVHIWDVHDQLPRQSPQ